MTEEWCTVATHTPTIGKRYWCRFMNNTIPMTGLCTYVGNNNWETKVLNDEEDSTWTVFHIPEMEFQEFNEITIEELECLLNQ